MDAGATSKSGDLPMIALTLQRLVQSGQLTIEEIARAWHLAPASVYAYLNGDRLPTIDRVCDLLDRGNVQVQEALIHEVLRYAPNWVATRVEPEGNPAGDGDVDLDDLVAQAIEVCDRGVTSLKSVHGAAADRRLTASEIDVLCERAGQVIHALVVYQQSLAAFRRVHTRKPASQSLVVGGSLEGQ